MSDETARLIERTADDLFAAEGEAARRALAEGAWPERLWRTFAETGLAQAALPEAAGGAGLAAGLAVMRAAGRHAAPIPVAETMVGALLCHEAGVEPPPGPLTVSAPATEQDTGFRRAAARPLGTVRVGRGDRHAGRGAGSLQAGRRDRRRQSGGRAARRCHRGRTPRGPSCSDAGQWMRPR